jgi:hypothetical protein
MKRSPVAIPALIWLLAWSCDDRRYELGQLRDDLPDAAAPSDPDAGAPPQGGAAGSGAGGAVAVADGAAGSGGTGGPQPAGPPIAAGECPIPATTIPVRPLGITSEQLAERLAAFIWNDRPDAALLAETAMIPSTGGVGKMAYVMVRDPRFARGVEALAREWLGLDSVLTVSPDGDVASQVSPGLRESMVRETSLFVQDQFVSGTGTLESLLLADHSFIDDRLAKLYEITPPGGTDHVRTALDPRKRSGLLTHPSTLFGNAHISRRGSWLLRTFLCMEVPAPPPDVNIDALDPVPGETYRETLARMVAPAVCAGCHTHIDPPAFALEHFDTIGRWRDADNGKPIDVNGSLMSPTSARVNFDGARQLAQVLASSCDVQRCLAQKVLQRSLGQRQGPLDEQSRGEIARAFVASGRNLRELFVATAISPAFLAP